MAKQNFKVISVSSSVDHMDRLLTTITLERVDMQGRRGPPTVKIETFDEADAARFYGGALVELDLNPGDD